MTPSGPAGGAPLWKQVPAVHVPVFPPPFLPGRARSHPREESRRLPSRAEFMASQSLIGAQ
jgi:hypothetical protein